MMIKLPIAILGVSTLLSLLAQAGQQLPTGSGDVANLSAVVALIWIVVKVLPKIHADYLKAFREERAADRESSERALAAYREELREMRNI